MNAAFRRRDAISRLEDYAPVIVEHLALMTWFSHHPSSIHWKAELEAFLTTLRRYDRGKKRAHNFDVLDIIETLEEEIEGNSRQDDLLIGISGHGVTPPDSPDWKSLHLAIHDYAVLIINH